MKNLSILVALFFAIGFFFISCQDINQPENSQSQKTTLEKHDGCLTIQSGEILYSAGHYLGGTPIMTGYDIFGYNYQAHMFKGSYANVYLGADGFPPYNGDDDAYLAANPGAAATWYWPYRMYEIEMKWNDAWLSNKDCDADGKLDRYLGYDSYIGSGAWEMYSEKMGGADGYTYKCKIIAVPTDAYNESGIWYNADGTEIGPVIWTDFAIIQERYR